MARNPALVPDVLLSMDVELPADLHPKRHRSYFLWEYGKPPDVVIEVVSNREGGEDTQKLAAYARGRVPYYVIFDPDRLLKAEVLRGYRLDPVEYRRLDEPIEFPDIGLGLRLWKGRYEGQDITWLRWVDASGVPIATGQERAGVANSDSAKPSGSARSRAATRRPSGGTTAAAWRRTERPLTGQTSSLLAFNGCFHPTSGYTGFHQRPSSTTGKLGESQ